MLNVDLNGKENTIRFVRSNVTTVATYGYLPEILATSTEERNSLSTKHMKRVSER